MILTHLLHRNTYTKDQVIRIFLYGSILPDGEPRVFEDPDNPGKYRIYIIGSHDVRFTSYCGPDIRAWSAPVEDLSSWRDEGAIFTYPIDGQWDVMYAPDLVEVKERMARKNTIYIHTVVVHEEKLW